MFLLDTHALLWMFSSPELLGAAAHRVVKDRKNKVYASMASIWEIGVKISVGKLNMPDGVDFLFLVEKEIKTSSLILLLIRVSHVSVVSRLAPPSPRSV